MSVEHLATLRGGYDEAAFTAANRDAMAGLFPALAAYGRGVSESFFEEPSGLPACERERCLIAVLTAIGVPTSLAVHIYWGLMAGLSVQEVCQVISLSGCYSGLARTSQGLLVLRQTLEHLRTLAEGGIVEADQVLAALVATDSRGSASETSTRY
ncbi:MAG: carboxymuconolactone decarboxylase family protein [Myxococcales bacterium]|nr:carboxymuconolactone decarboxylase family protein [Myxococcales bacterium]